MSKKEGGGPDPRDPTLDPPVSLHVACCSTAKLSHNKTFYSFQLMFTMGLVGV